MMAGELQSVVSCLHGGEVKQFANNQTSKMMIALDAAARPGKARE